MHSMKRSKWFSLWLVWLVLGAHAHGSETDWQFSTFYTQYGLPFQEVRDLLAHPDGSMWICTWGGGVTRVRDAEWQQFDESNGLPGNWTYCLALGADQSVWVGTADGLARIQNGKLAVFRRENVELFPNNGVRGVACLPDGRIWLAFDDSSLILEGRATDDGVVWTEAPAVGVNESAKKQLFVDRDGTVWLANSSREVFRYQDDAWERVETRAQRITQAADGSIYGIDSSHVRRQVHGQWESEALPPGEIGICIAPGPSGAMLVGTRKSLYVWRPGKFQEIELGERQYARAIVYLEDREHLYYGTRYGVQRATRPTWRRYTAADEHRLTPESFCFDQQGRAICATERGGVAMYDGEMWREHFVIDDPLFRPRKMLVIGDSLWALGWDSLFEIDLPTRKVLRKLPPPAKANMATANLPGFFANSSGQIWCLYDNGIFAVTDDGYRQIDAARDSNYASPQAVAEAKDGSFYICYRDRDAGIGTVEQFDGEKFTSISQRYPSLRNWDFEAVMCGRDGRIWLGTHDGGVFVLKGDRVERITIQDGLYSNLVSKVWESPDGVVWIAYRENGVGSLQDGLWLHYGVESGLPRWTIEHVGQDSEGRLWVAKPAPSWNRDEVQGVFLYNPDRDPPTTHITAYPKEGIASHGIDVFSFRGRDPWGQTPNDRLMYSYRFVSLDKSGATTPWSPYTANTSIVTDDAPLPSGRYRFEVRALDLSRNVDPTPATVDVKVVFPVWQRPELLVPVCLLLFVASVATWTSVRNHHAALAAAREQIRAHEEAEVLRQQLFVTQKLEVVGTFAAGLAHDINNTLGAIMCFSEAAKMRAKGNAQLTPLLDGIDQASQQAAGITRSLLTFSRQSAAEKSPHSLSEVVEAVIPITKQLFGKSITLNTELLQERVLKVDVEPTQIHQVILNIAMNAKDAMPDGGEFWITTELRTDEHQQEFAVLTLRDSGGGMSEDVRKRIFEPFFTTKVREKGTGLGMSIVHGIVEDHEGRVEVDSRVGEGASFTIWLPLSTTNAAPSSASPVAAAGNSLKHMLIVEDNPQFRELLAKATIEAGYEVLTAVDGEQGVNVFREAQANAAPIDVLVVDLELPKLDGPGCIQQIRAIRPDIQVILMSGGEHLAEASRQIEDCHPLAKPFSASQLMQLVHSLSDRKSSRSAG